MQSRFPETLTAYREQANLTRRGLARGAGVPESLICGLEKGSRRVGEANARQIGEALGLLGSELNDFILQAIDTSTRKLLKQAEAYPAKLINFMATELNRAGIEPELVADCGYTSPDRDNLTLFLADGRIARLSANVIVA
jgi:transcriptional regulator with XRE-family HTH domain